MRANELKNVTGLATGFIDLDYWTGGLQPSDLILLAARPSMGKTALALSIARNIASTGKQCVAIFTLEMSTVEPDGGCVFGCRVHLLRHQLCLP